MEVVSQLLPKQQRTCRVCGFLYSLNRNKGALEFRCRNSKCCAALSIIKVFSEININRDCLFVPHWFLFRRDSPPVIVWRACPKRGDGWNLWCSSSARISRCWIVRFYIYIYKHGTNNRSWKGIIAGKPLQCMCTRCVCIRLLVDWTWWFVTVVLPRDHRRLISCQCDSCYDFVAAEIIKWE